MLRKGKMGRRTSVVDKTRCGFMGIVMMRNLNSVFARPERVNDTSVLIESSIRRKIVRIVIRQGVEDSIVVVLGGKVIIIEERLYFQSINRSTRFERWSYRESRKIQKAGVDKLIRIK